MKIETMHYDEKDLRAIEATGRLDANESVFFARQLEYIRPKTYDVKRAALSAVTLMPVDTRRLPVQILSPIVSTIVLVRQRSLHLMLTICRARMFWLKNSPRLLRVLVILTAIRFKRFVTRCLPVLI